MEEVSTHLRLLIVEDSESDAELDVLALEQEGFEIEWAIVETEPDFVAGLDRLKPQLILSDHSMPTFDSARALKLLREHDPDVPFILVTGTIGEEAAASMIRAGANDYVLKHNLSRLGLCVRRELRDAHQRRERRRVQRALRISELRYRTLVVASAQLLWWSDSQGQVIEAHPSWVEYTGQTAQETAGTGWLSAVHEEDASRVQASWARAVLKREMFHEEYRIRRHDGRYRWFSARGVPVLGDDGDVLEWVGACTDITEQREAQAAVRASELKYRELFNAASDAIMLLDQTVIVDCNPRAEMLFGRPRARMLNAALSDFVVVDDTSAASAHDFVAEQIREAQAGKAVFFEWQGVRDDGERFWAEASLNALLMDGKSLVQGMVRDVTRRREAEQLSRKLSGSVEQAADSIFITDVNGTIEYANPACLAMTGYSAEELVGETPRVLCSGRHDNAYFRRMWQTLLQGQTFRDVVINRRKDGELYFEEKTISPLKDDAGQITHLISTGRDVTGQMEIQERMAYMAYHDPLTDLPNRHAFLEAGAALLRSTRDTRACLLIAYLGVDRFKLINEAAGHETGDQALCRLGDRLNALIDPPGIVARITGDEFAIAVPMDRDRQPPEKWALRLQECVAERLLINGSTLFLSVSIGISVYPGDDDSIQGLTRCAQAAMHKAKEESPGSSRSYSRGLFEQAARRLNIENELHRALDNDELRLFYQPQADMRTGLITGAEALMRWDHPDRGLLSPCEFLHVVEQSSLVAPVGEWLVHAACRQVRDMKQRALPMSRVSINLSWSQLHIGQDIDWFLGVLASYGLDTASLGIELTESTLAREPEKAARMLHTAREAGLHVALDDFGTGSSSLSYLKLFPIDTVKIDQSFVREVTCRPEDAAIVRAIIAMGHHLNMTVLAEGVERPGQLAFLGHEGCDEMQGFLYANPMPAQDYADFVTAPPQLQTQPSTDLLPGVLLLDADESQAALLAGWLNERGVRLHTGSMENDICDLLAMLPRVRLLIFDPARQRSRADARDLLHRITVLYPRVAQAVLTSKGFRAAESHWRDAGKWQRIVIETPLRREDIDRLIAEHVTVADQNS